ncbi:kinesin-like protein KIN-10B isoform X2 [Manihot esculenta]|uniref:Kinesin-like protein n=1 Tax=Manihot esculenta TaxID=3983 RepID=A0A2C9VFZ4_MANES|nr:kinesin-like protein KIN-10B isoform X2 [Manihot esculenta]OAY43563.1 hypothetical protein MANES_08G079300v8 [Manihot esculenta]
MENQSGSLNTPRSLKTCSLENPMDGNFISKVRVIVRVRPFLPHEITAKNGNPSSCISVVDQDCDPREEVTVRLKDPDSSRNEFYQLDSFFGQEDNSVIRIFEREVNPLIPGIFQGYNATVFAYGATGSGKTYTMQGTDQLPGLMVLAMSKILSIYQSTSSTVELSYYEVYMDRCYDLLELKAKEIAILDDKDGQTHLKGLSRIPVNSMSEFQEIFSRGTQRRKIAHTGLNDVSSRSHGVLVIGVSTPCNDGSGAVLAGKLNLIDLAGNEDNRRTGNEGIRLQESAKINQSLFTLSNVIHALNNSKPRVPYRESKLTRILQDSLGGTSRALMVACLNPGEYQESVHTVSLAARSRHVSNFVSSTKKLETPKGKVDMEAKLRAWLESKGKTKSAQRNGAYASPFTLSSVKQPINKSTVKAKVNSNRGTSTQESTKAVPVRNLFNTEGFNDSSLETPQFVAEDNREETSADSAETVLEPTTQTAVESLHKLEMNTLVDSNKSMGASPISGNKNALGNPSRKVLSPINANIEQLPHEEVASAERKCPVFFEPKTPITPFTVTRANDKFTTGETPLDKFSAMSATLKSSLMQEYIDFLNKASREELLEIKGIGLKMAEYIVDLREASPLKSLSDLEKLGLSSKQVHNMFSKAARGIFDRHEVPTPSWPETLTS